MLRSMRRFSDSPTRQIFAIAIMVATCSLLFSSAQDPVYYTHNGESLQGYIYYPDVGTIPEAEINGGQVPLVVIVPDKAGITNFELSRASTMSQDWKYVAFVADVYGANGRNITDPSESDTLAAAWRSNATAFAERIQNGVNAAVEAWSIFVNWEGTVERVALAGYGLGGTGALMHAMLGWDTVDAVVAFDPDGLESLPPPAAVVAPKVLVLSGEETDASATIMHLEETLNNANATWEITRLSEVEVGQDGYFRAWVDSHRFFRDTLSYNGSSIFASPYQPGYWEDPSPPETIRVTTTLYTDVDGTELRGYLARPNDAVFASPHPTIIILPDWDGVNYYEQQRATKLSGRGYVAFAADIYGADLQENLTMDQRLELSSTYRENPNLFIQRIKRALEVMQTNFDFVDPENIAVIGYCFGGTGVIQLAFSGDPTAKVVVSFHGGLAELPTVTTSIVPYTLILSGGDDDAHGNQTELEAALDAANATWEVTRYAGVVHGFTDWSSEAYNFMADARSWDSMLSIFSELLAGPDLVSPTASPSDSPSAVPTTSPRPSTLPTISPGVPSGPTPSFPRPSTMTPSDLPSGVPSAFPSISIDAGSPTRDIGSPTGGVSETQSTSDASIYLGFRLSTVVLSAILAIALIN